MRILKGGVAHVSGVIEEDLRDRETRLHKAHIEGIADLTATVLACWNFNSGDWISILPRKTGDEKSKERYISRLLSNPLIKPFYVMRGFIPEIAEMLTEQGQTLVLMLDQSKIREGFECLMVSLRLAERALPVGWIVVETQGPLGFDVQKELLDHVKTLLPEGVSILLSADRFYGTSALIEWCKKARWHYRIRLKSNLILNYKGRDITTGEEASQNYTSLEKAYFNRTNVFTNIGILHEEGHKEPWIIAMDCIPSQYKVLDYGMRWGIECLFSDFKSRGFSITTTHLKHTDRIERLILILTIALYWAVSTGMKPRIPKTRSKKNSTDL
ncbi:MAG: transposase [Proteobacteria bacterium]|nr:transposase [Pseudomonadota bacterium]